VALTFDDGPEPGTTTAVLDRLDALGLRATFFCLGERVLQHPGLAVEIAARGHEVATHGHQHRSHFSASARWIGDDLRRSTDAIVAAGLPAPRWFRPPYGHVAAGTLLHARRSRLPVVLWSAMGREWHEPSAQHVARRIRRNLSPGAIVVLHDSEITPGSSGRVLDALPQIAAELDQRGWTTAALSDLVGRA
jgi:peptidoglycan/xylan/chitin deacetylase (PgdA/CDA1 family)